LVVGGWDPRSIRECCPPNPFKFITLHSFHDHARRQPTCVSPYSFSLAWSPRETPPSSKNDKIAAVVVVVVVVVVMVVVEAAAIVPPPLSPLLVLLSPLLEGQRRSLSLPPGGKRPSQSQLLVILSQLLVQLSPLPAEKLR
jgi:hypothetical protein